MQNGNKKRRIGDSNSSFFRDFKYGRRLSSKRLTLY